MIVFDLECTPGGHRFEGWFASSEAFAQQFERGLVRCPHCDCTNVSKALMTPNLGRKGNQAATMQSVPKPVSSAPLAPQVQELMGKLARMQAEALKGSRWVGAGFAEESRAIHYGEREAEVIHGQATPDEARQLLDEGIALTPLPFPIAPPDEVN